VSTHPSPLARPVRDGLAHARVNSSVALWAGALSAAIVVASALAYDTKVGVEILLAACVVPLAFFRLRAAICVWVVLLFFSRTAALESVPNKLLLLIVIAWVAMLFGATRTTSARESFRQNRTIVLCALAFLIWTILTLAWAPDPGSAERAVKELIYAGLGLTLCLGAILERRHVRWVMMAFVLGAALSVLWGAAKGGLSVHAGGGEGEVANADGRFQGGAGDPNYLAAVLVPAIMLAGGLAIWRSATRRTLLALATFIIAVGLAATQSRGGLIGAAVCAGVALFIWKGRRALILGLIGLALLALVSFFVANPSALARLQESNQGSGRVDIWTVAWRVVHDHPLAGVGIAQFPQVSPHYTLQPGALRFVGLIVEKHIVVHNLYLQLWVETGIVGLLLFLGVIWASLARALSAARSFDRQGDTEMSALTRAAALALVGMLTASFFLSNIEAGQLWVLLAMGPVLAGIAERQSRASPLLASSPLGAGA
jgi:O-antigen ligase